MPEATCKHCRKRYTTAMWDTKPRLPQHKDPRDPVYACKGSDQYIDIAGVEYDGPEDVQLFGKIRGRRGSNIGDKIEKSTAAANAPRKMPKAAPSFYDREEQQEKDDDQFPF